MEQAGKEEIVRRLPTPGAGWIGHFFPPDQYQIEYKPGNPVYLLAMPQPIYKGRVEGSR